MDSPKGQCYWKHVHVVVSSCSWLLWNYFRPTLTNRNPLEYKDYHSWCRYSHYLIFIEIIFILVRLHIYSEMGPMGLFQYKMFAYWQRKSNCGDMTVLWLPYFRDTISDTGRYDNIFILKLAPPVTWLLNRVWKYNHDNVWTHIRHPISILMVNCLVNSCPPSAAYIRQWTRSALVQIMACHLFGAKPLTEPILGYYQEGFWEQISVKFKLEFYHFHFKKCIWSCRLPKWRPFCPVNMSILDEIYFMILCAVCWICSEFICPNSLPFVPLTHWLMAEVAVILKV